MNAPGQLQWLGFNVSSSRKPSLISPSQLLSGKSSPTSGAPMASYMSLLVMVEDSNPSTFRTASALVTYTELNRQRLR